MMMGFGILGLIFMLAFWGIIIVLALWLVGRLFPQTTNAPPHQYQPGRPRELSDTSLEILKQRYARGEISKDEYDEIRQDLM